jgi:predicted ATPase/transcriptional regulator with XRE-family HTH domain
METFGEWLQHQRSLRRLTREEFAKRVGCSVSALRKIEYGARRPSAQIAELMANCLDVPPEERSTFVRVARGELSVDRLPLESKSVITPNISPKINLPIFPTPLIGRDHAVEQLSQLVGDPQCRLLTLVGPGGIGKTRLAIEAASNMQDVFTDGVYFVPLAPVGLFHAVIATIANAIHVAFYGPSDPRAQLLNYLREKQMLLIVDNVEHLLAGGPHEETVVGLSIEILQQAAQVKLLATSREPLGLQDEWVFEVQGLPVPESISADGIAQNTSVELFLQRARRANVRFDATPDDFPPIVRICQLVDGNPLGLELAAAWVRTLSCDEIEREIERGLDFLSISARDIPARHRSMRAVFDHSWKLLSEEEQKILMRLSAFHGGFKRDAAEQGAEATLAVLSTLVMKSLIRRSGAGRYDLHELIRQFAASNLAKDPEEMRTAQERHSLYYLGLLEEQGRRLQSHQQKQAVAELTADMDNIRAAWDWSIANHEFIRLYQVSAGLMHLCEIRNWFKEAEITFRKTADSLQARPRESKLDVAHQVALHAMLAHWGFFRFRLGKGEEAYNILSSSAAFLRTNGGSFAAVYSHLYLGIVCWILGKFSEAMESLQDGRKLAREYGMRWHEAMDNEFLGRVAIDQGKYDQAEQYLSEALALLRQLGDPSMMAHALSYLGRTMQLLGEYREAKKLLQESLELSRENGYRFATGLALDGLGRVAYAEGRYEEAQPFFSESAHLFQEMGDTHRLSRTLNHQGLNSLALKQAVKAQNDFNSALRLAYEGGSLPSALNALTGLAALEAKEKATQRTLEMILYILQHPASARETKDLATRLQLELESKLPPEQVEAAEQNIGLKSLEEFVQPFLTSFDSR